MANKRVQKAFSKFQRIQGIRAAIENSEATRRDMARMLVPAEKRSSSAPTKLYGAKFNNKRAEA